MRYLVQYFKKKEGEKLSKKFGADLKEVMYFCTFFSEKRAVCCFNRGFHSFSIAYMIVLFLQSIPY